MSSAEVNLGILEVAVAMSVDNHRREHGSRMLRTRRGPEQEHAHRVRSGLKRRGLELDRERAVHAHRRAVAKRIVAASGVLPESDKHGIDWVTRIGHVPREPY